MDKIRKQTVTDVHPWDRIPLILKSISGFNSCLTVSVMSVIFIWSAHISVSKSISDWPGIITLTLMVVGPIIIALNFVNAKSVIGTILSKANEEGENVTKIEIPSATGIVTEDDIAVERELTGPTTVILRAIAGFVAVHVICFCSLLFTWTIHNSMLSGYHLPANMQLFMVVVGPIITSWNFVRANATLNAVIKGATELEHWRDRLANVIATKK